MVRFCDLFAAYLGILDTSPRRNYYGSLGNFRPKEYGIEYRSLPTSSLLQEETTTLLSLISHVVNFQTIAQDFYVDFNWEVFRGWWGLQRAAQAKLTAQIKQFVMALKKEAKPAKKAAA